MASFRPTLQEYRSVGDPLLACDYYLMIPNIPGSQDPRAISFKFVSTSLPGTQIEQVSLEIGARRFNFAGRRKYSGTWTSTLIETANASTRRDLINWMNIARPYNSNIGTFRNEYAQTAEIRVYDAAQNLAISSTVLALFPLSIDDVSLEQSDSIIQYQVTWSFDSTEELIGGE